MKTTRLIGKYLTDHIKVIIAFIVYTAILTFSFFLFDFPLESILYAFVVSLFPIFVFVVIDFLRHRARYLEIYRLKKALSSGIAKLNVSGKSIERELIEVIDSMNKTIEEIKVENIKSQKDAEEYYTLWVHQIKTPISAMHLLLQKENGKDMAVLRQELFKIEIYVEMVLGYLRISSINSDLNFKQCNVHDVVIKSVKKFAPTFIYKKIGVEVADFENKVVTDEKWLMFVIEQILSNSLKYTESGEVKIYMDTANVLYIEDTGIGISKEDLPRVFERGFTGYNGRVNQSSTGLGLYLCKKVMKRLGSKIVIDSNIDEGTVVKLDLHKDEFVSGD